MMDPNMKQLQENLVDIETGAEQVLLARHQVLMKEMEGSSGKQLIKEICPTCGDHDPKEHTWLMFPGSDIFARVPFHVAHTVLEKDQERLDIGSKKLQSFVKEKSLVIAEKGALAGRFGADTEILGWST
uniref:Uncharacterized protein n=1 Tax=Setaria italica TaxID=4555 RepID=K3YMG0_SETIT